MTPITWVFCIAALCTIMVNTQVDAVQPLVMAVYVQEDKRNAQIESDSNENDDTRRIIVTDAEKENVDNLILSFGNTQPTYIALLCGGTGDDVKEHGFIVKQVTDKIDSIDKSITCEHLLQPYVIMTTSYSHIMFPNEYDIGFEFGVPEEMWSKKQEEPDTESSRLLQKFINEFDIESQTDYGNGKYFKIEYNFNKNFPVTISHTVIAHMHSNEYEKNCEKIYIPNENVDGEKRSRDELAAQFQSNQTPPDHQWRQLAPYQDFKGIYPTQATCIYLNYILVNEKAIESLERIEIFIRKVADVINEVDVITGIKIKENNDSVTSDDQNKAVIPIMVGKQIICTLDGKKYSVVVIIHNQTIKKICENEKGWGWPEYNNNEEENGIGTMYYCVVNTNYYEPFNLNEIMPDQITSIWKMIHPQESSSQTEKEPPK